MPAIKKVSCKNCEYEKIFSSKVLYVTWQGEDHVLPHPREESACEMITGFGIAEAKKRGILYVKTPNICRSCGNLGMYKDNEIFCEQCASSKLISLAAYPGWIDLIFREGETTIDVKCPSCFFEGLVISIFGVS